MSELVQQGDNDYYQEYCRLYLTNVALMGQVKQLIADKLALSQKLRQLEERENETGNPSYDQAKRHRRTACEIRRHYKCPAQDCEKSYGSEGSLNQHLKIKHPEIDYKAFLLELPQRQNNPTESRLGAKHTNKALQDRNCQNNVNYKSRQPGDCPNKK